MEFKRRVLEITFDGTKYSIKYPTMRIIKENEERLGKDLEGIIDFLDQLGLPKHVSMEMEPEHIEQIVQKLTEKKPQPN